MKKKTLKQVAAEMLNKGNFIKFESREWNFYNSTLVVIDTKLYKPKQTEKNPPKHIYTIQFDNKTLEGIRLQKFSILLMLFHFYLLIYNLKNIIQL